MKFFTVLNSFPIPTDRKEVAFLMVDNWDDWFKYSTRYDLFIIDSKNEQHIIGGVKIGQFEMKNGQRRPDIPKSFDQLSSKFFSLGQDDSYYQKLNDLGKSIRDKVLDGLNDIARDPILFKRALNEPVAGESLLRDIDYSTVSVQFNRMSRGGARLTDYQFTYTARQYSDNIAPITMDYVVTPESQPPTNIHVLIGRNGVGKTTLLSNMARAIVDKKATQAEVGKFEIKSENNEKFTSLVSVTFSAFDPFEPINLENGISDGVRYVYIGLKHLSQDNNGNPTSPKTPDQLANDFSKSLIVIRRSAPKTERWKKALETLESDPTFKTIKISSIADKFIQSQRMPISEETENNLGENSKQFFRRFSAGHKIVLLTITRIVETLEEKTLVLLDEPEAHLHPPLVSAFIRALSELLINRNGVAIIATHSPVVLQEVPASCVWIIRRAGQTMKYEKPKVQTFGENVGILTREVFKLEVFHSGFHDMLREKTIELRDYEKVVKAFKGELGDEAHAIIQVYIQNIKDEEDK